MKTPLDVAVLVVTYNSSALVEELVASLPSGLDGLSWCLVVADNASSDGTAARVSEVSPTAIVVETGRNGGYAAGINAALDAAPRHRAALVLNPDVRLMSGAVPALLAAFQEPTVGIAVPRLLNAKGELIPSQRREPTVLRAWADALIGAARAGRYPLLGEVATDPRLYDEAVDTDWAEGSTMLIRSECLEACGRWDESFFLYSEETEFALRARDAGFRTRYIPGATAVHLEGGSSPELWSLLVLNRVRLYRRRHRLVPTVAFWAALLARESTRAALGRPTSRAAARALISPARFAEKPGPDSVRRGRSPRTHRRKLTAGA